MDFQVLKSEALKDEEFKKEWEAKAPFWQIQEQLIKARIASNFTQSQIAKKSNSPKCYSKV